jgi:flagellar motor switch protein FliN/FliY
MPADELTESQAHQDAENPNVGDALDEALMGLGANALRDDSLGFVMDVPVRLTVEIGRKAMRIAEILRLGPGSILELNKANGEPLEVYANDRLVARGEAVVVGERYGVRLTEVLVGSDVDRDDLEGAA